MMTLSDKTAQITSIKPTGSNETDKSPSSELHGFLTTIAMYAKSESWSNKRVQETIVKMLDVGLRDLRKFRDEQIRRETHDDLFEPRSDS